jgi:DNA-binding NarL/FixJ family response regulator
MILLKEAGMAGKSPQAEGFESVLKEVSASFEDVAKRLERKMKKLKKHQLTEALLKERPALLLEVERGPFLVSVSLRPDWHRNLTPRQKQLLAQLRLGLTNKEIAQRMGVSQYTVAAHLRNIGERTYLHNRHALAFWGGLGNNG